MSLVSPRLVLVIAAFFAAAPAVAQDAPPADTVTPAPAAAEPAPQAEAPTGPAADAPLPPEEIAFNERASALSRRVLAVDEEMKSAARLAALDPAVATTALDDIQTGFQGEIDAFIQDFFSFAAERFLTMPENEQVVFRTNVENTAGQLSILPQAMRDRAVAAALLPPPSQATPSAD